MKQKTREELIKQVAEFQIANDSWEKADKTRREQFSKILGAPSRMSYGTETHDLYSWAEIFTEVGKLLAKEDSLAIHRKIGELAHTVEHLELAIIEDEPHEHSGH